jgi:hypothetical protein
MLTERRHSTSSIFWRIPLWQTIADHGRVFYAIASLQSHPRLPITHTLRRLCCLCSFNLNKPSPSPFQCHTPTCAPLKRNSFLVSQYHIPIPVARAERRCRSPCLACIALRGLTPEIIMVIDVLGILVIPKTNWQLGHERCPCNNNDSLQRKPPPLTCKSPTYEPPLDNLMNDELREDDFEARSVFMLTVQSKHNLQFAITQCLFC